MPLYLNKVNLPFEHLWNDDWPGLCAYRGGMQRFLPLLALVGLASAQAVTPTVNARIQGSQVVAKDLAGNVVWQVAIPRFNGRVGVWTWWLNNWIPDSVIIGGRDELGYQWFTVLERQTGKLRWQTRGVPLAYARGKLLVQPEIPSGYANRWKLQRFAVSSGQGELFEFRYDRSRRGCGTMIFSGSGNTSYSFPSSRNPRRMVINAADECSELELTFDWLGDPQQVPQVRALPCLNDAFQIIPCARNPK